MAFSPELLAETAIFIIITKPRPDTSMPSKPIMNDNESLFKLMNAIHVTK